MNILSTTTARVRKGTTSTTISVALNLITNCKYYWLLVSYNSVRSANPIFDTVKPIIDLTNEVIFSLFIGLKINIMIDTHSKQSSNVAIKPLLQQRLHGKMRFASKWLEWILLLCIDLCFSLVSQSRLSSKPDSTPKTEGCSNWQQHNDNTRQSEKKTRANNGVLDATTAKALSTSRETTQCGRHVPKRKCQCFEQQ